MCACEVVCFLHFVPIACCYPKVQSGSIIYSAGPHGAILWTSMGTPCFCDLNLPVDGTDSLATRMTMLHRCMKGVDGVGMGRGVTHTHTYTHTYSVGFGAVAVNQILSGKIPPLVVSVSAATTHTQTYTHTHTHTHTQTHTHTHTHTHPPTHTHTHTHTHNTHTHTPLLEEQRHRCSYCCTWIARYFPTVFSSHNGLGGHERCSRVGKVHVMLCYAGPCHAMPCWTILTPSFCLEWHKPSLEGI